MASHINFGERIEQFRDRKKLTQKELADRVGLSRTAVTQIEQGKRNLSASELVRFSTALHIPVSDFFSDTPADEIEAGETNALHTGIRESQPPEKPDYDKFRNVLLYILEKCAGKPNVGETVLYKLLYFADFNHYEEHERFLTQTRYRKLPYGPVPFHLDQVIEKMIENGELQRMKTTYFNYPQTRYLPLQKPDLEKLTGAEKETLDQVIDYFSDWSASAISDYSHKDMPWKATKEGDVIDYELAFYREPPFSSRNYDYDEPESSDV